MSCQTCSPPPFQLRLRTITLVCAVVLHRKAGGGRPTAVAQPKSGNLVLWAKLFLVEFRHSLAKVAGEMSRPWWQTLDNLLNAFL